jgi:hypothetical protein
MTKNLINKNKNFSVIKNLSAKNKFYFQKFKMFTTTTPAVATGPKKTHGGLKDSDRIFTNVYRDGDPFIEGALKRVNNKMK